MRIKIDELCIKNKLSLVRYQVLPTASDGGMVEVVTDSTTLYDIEQRVGYSIAQYLIDHNGADIEAAQRRFIESLAAYLPRTGYTLQ